MQVAMTVRFKATMSGETEERKERCLVSCLRRRLFVFLRQYGARGIDSVVECCYTVHLHAVTRAHGMRAPKRAVDELVFAFFLAALVPCASETLY